MDKLTTKFQLALADAQSLAVGRDHQFIEPTHLLMALLDQDGGTARGLLVQAGVGIDQLRLGLLEALDRLPQVEGTPGEVHLSKELNRLLNVTDKLDPVIGRDDEIRRAIQVLQRRTKNNPVLIGEPGVGKTAPEASD